MVTASRWFARWPLVALCACGVEADVVPEGKLAVVGEVAIGPEDLASVQSQLGVYAQRRFRGADGRRHLLESVIAAELLAQEAVANGLGEDPRVQWSIVEELALLYLNAELERRVPYEAVASDERALRAYLEAHPEEFRVPERRSLRGAPFRDYEEASRALSELKGGKVELESFGKLLTTPLQERSDEEHPGFHAYVFDSSLSPGDLVPHVVYSGDVLLVGRLEQLEPEGVEDFDDPSVRERLVQAVRAPLRAAAQAELLAELAERYPL